MVLMNLFTEQQWRIRHREQACGHSRGRRERDQFRVYHGNIYITTCKIDSWWRSAI